MSFCQKIITKISYIERKSYYQVIAILNVVLALRKICPPEENMLLKFPFCENLFANSAEYGFLFVYCKIVIFTKLLEKN